MYFCFDDTFNSSRVKCQTFMGNTNLEKAADNEIVS